MIMSNMGARVQALGWAHKLDTAEQIQADGPEFETWMAQSAEQDDAYHLAERTRCQVELYRKAILEAGVFDEEMLLNRLKQHYASPRGRKVLRIGVPLAATATMIVVIALVMSLAHMEQLLWSHINTAARQVSTVTLEDSSVVVFGSESPLRGAGEVAQIGPGGIRVEKVNAIGARRRLAWVDGQLDFDVPLVEAVNEFNRYNRRKLVIDQHRLDAVPVAGRYDAYNPDLFADELRRTHHIEYSSTGTPGSNQGEIHLQFRDSR